MTLYEKLLELKKDAMRPTSVFTRLERDAYNAVITAIQSANEDDYKIAKTDAYVIKQLKKEIKAYSTAMSNDKQYLEDCKFKAATLGRLLPPPLSKEDLYFMVNAYILQSKKDNNIPAVKDLLSYLNNDGYEGRYEPKHAIELLKAVLDDNK